MLHKIPMHYIIRDDFYQIMGKLVKIQKLFRHRFNHYFSTRVNILSFRFDAESCQNEEFLGGCN